MKRYTRDFKHCMAVDKNGTKHYQEGIYIENGGDRKLFDLENLEEELGLDLITLFKALKKRVYILNDEHNKSSCLVGLSYGFNHERKKWSLLGFAYGYEAEEWLSLKDYRKTWALTKEELEKDEA